MEKKTEPMYNTKGDLIYWGKVPLPPLPTAASLCCCVNPKVLTTAAAGNNFKVCALSKGGCGKEIS